MDLGFWFFVSLCVSVLLKSFISVLLSPSTKLPPEPTPVAVVGNFLWFRKSFLDIELILRDLKPKFGPILTLRIGSLPAIFVSSHSIAHRALVQNGAIFSDRPKALPTARLLNSNQHNINSAPYGSTWRLQARVHCCHEKSPACQYLLQRKYCRSGMKRVASYLLAAIPHPYDMLVYLKSLLTME